MPASNAGFSYHYTWYRKNPSVHFLFAFFVLSGILTIGETLQRTRMTELNNKWGFLAPTIEDAAHMKQKYGEHFTPLIEYMKVIFPDIDDWEEEQYIDTGWSDEDQKLEFIKPHLSSRSGRKIVNIGTTLDLYDENENTESFISEPISHISDYDIYYIDRFTQLTNATVKQIFGLDVAESLFDENTPTLTQPWVDVYLPKVATYYLSENSAEDFLKGKYVGDEKQYQVNFDAYNALRAFYLNIGISKILVDKLFDSYSYEIDLNTDKNISILIGPNGCGKTTILKIIRFMLSGIGNVEEILQIPFKSITCELSNGRKIKLEFLHNKLTAFIDSKEAAVFGEDQGLDLADNVFRFQVSLKEFHCHFNTKFISAQRLLSEIDEETDDARQEGQNVRQYADTISKIKEDFKEFCEQTEKEYNQEKSSAEHHLFDNYIKYGYTVLDDALFEEQWKEFSAQRNEYEQNKALIHFFSHLDDDKVIEQYKNKGVDKKFLCLYLEMFKGTLVRLGKAHEKTMLFQEIINDRFKITKKQLQYRYGEMYLTVGNGKKTKEIPFKELSKVLSSGEKNDFIMFYNLIFNCKNSKVFIDEPEISLHIEWQERYINDLYRICQMNNIQALVATHSPNIINEHTDLLTKWDIKDV